MAEALRVDDVRPLQQLSEVAASLRADRHRKRPFPRAKGLRDAACALLGRVRIPLARLFMQRTWLLLAASVAHRATAADPVASFNAWQHFQMMISHPFLRKAAASKVDGV